MDVEVAKRLLHILDVIFFVVVDILHDIVVGIRVELVDATTKQTSLAIRQRHICMIKKHA